MNGHPDRGAWKAAVAAMLCALAMPAPALAQGGELAMLGGLQPGQWELRFRDKASGSQQMCLRDGRELIQLRHSGLRCQQIVVTDTPANVTVQYVCPSYGYGRTQIRRESSHLVQIDSQGIARGLPFAFAAEARRVGSCR